MNLIKPGTRVELGYSRDKFTARVLAACIRGPELGVQYEVAWFSGRERKTAWVESDEIRRHDEAEGQLSIGFRAEEGQ